MSQAKRISVPPGLPVHLSVGKEGYETLCALLGATTRNHKQALANSPWVKHHLKSTGNAAARQTGTAERIRQTILALYSDPGIRRRLWRNIRDHEPSGTTGSMPFPSLEYAALSRYDAALISASPDPERLVDLSSFHVSDLTSDDWRAPALAALPRLKADLEKWSSVPPARRTAVIAAAFATATLLDDARLLLWAVVREKEIARQFFFLDKTSGHASETPPAADTEEDSAVDSEDDLPAKLQECSLALRDAAQNLADGPANAALFDVLAERYAEILELREPVLAKVDAYAISDTIADLANLLDEKAEEVSWLAQESESLLAAWRNAYSSAAGTRPEQVRVDLDRAVAALPAALAEAATAQADADAAKESLDRHDAEMADKTAPSHADRKRQATLSGTLATARQTSIDTMDEVLDVLKPRPDDVSSLVRSTAGGSGASTEHDALRPVADERALDHEGYIRPPPAGAAQLVPESATDPRSQTTEAKSSAEAKPDPVTRLQGEEASIDPVAPPDEGLSLEEAPPGPEEIPSAAVGESSDVTLASDPESEPLPVIDTAPLFSAQAAVWHAVGMGRVGLAYQIARLDQAIGHTAQPSPELLAALAFGTALRAPDDDLAAAFGRQVGVLGGLDFDGVDLPIRDALNLLRFAATLRPAVFASQHGASIPLLRQVELSGELSPVYRLAGAVADQADNLKTVRLDVPTLTAILGEGVWKDRIAAHCQNVEQWREGAAAATFLSTGAGAVWQQWLGRRGILGELTDLLATPRTDSIQRVQEIANLLDNRRDIRARIEETERRAVGRYGESISGRALSQLESRLAEPRDLALDWLHIMEARPGGAGFLETAVEGLRKVLDRHAPAAMEAITRLRQTEPTPALDGALACAARAIESLTDLCRRDSDACADIVLGPIQALSDDLLFVTSLRIDAEGAIDNSPSTADTLALLVDTASHAETLADAFDARLSLGDLYGADAVCKRMAAEDDADADASRELLDRELATSRSNLQRRLYDLAERLEQAFVIGEISEADRAELTALVNDTSRRLEDRAGALTAGDHVKAIATAVDPACERGIATVSSELDTYLPRIEAREQALVRDAVNARDLATLHEQLDCLKRGQPLRSPDSAGRSRLLRAFLAAADHIESELNGEAGPAPHALMEALEHRREILGLQFSTLSRTQSKRSAKLLETWFQIARQRSPDTELVAAFFAELGFTITHGAVQPRGDAAATLRTEPLRTRELCPTHAFGSDANGRYDLIFNWSALAREPIVQAIATADPNSHTIVLHFGKLNRVDRDWLRRWSIDHPTQFITVDETLVLYLASLPEGQLKAMFECTLPFTCIEPFFTAPGLVPPEAFFGRERERRDIVDPYGSCFVYGGRQLGKTALLHAAEAAFHDPGARRLAKYVDLKYEAIGIAYDADHIWQVLWREFVKLDVVDASTPMPRGRNSLVDALAKFVNGWLDTHKDKDGRILLLLDEADAFLAKDLEGDFRVSTRLKGLMDETERRFKVVLCGLHNVLRNTEQANHPLAHLGEPVCVGPLLSNGDLEQARALIREPTAAVGYKFETDNLISKILIWTNYYPSLIQLFGQALLRYLHQLPGRDFPRTITTDDIQAVFQRDQFRDYIRTRFSLTLQLDQRYEVIAYAMAFDLQGASHRLADGLTSNRIFDLAREHWPEGFRIPKREFETLLHEMCGLGVLRQRPSIAGSGRYVFRNPNVLLLLGDADTILDVLSKERELPDMFEASAFHAQYGRSKARSPRRGPLTYAQESVLNRGGRIAVLCGTRAANYADVGGFLGERVEKGRLRPLELSMDANALVNLVNRLRPDRDTYVCLVDQDEPWTLLWLRRVADALRTAQRGRKIRVVFRADPEQLWRFVTELPDDHLQPDNDLFDWVALQPWSARLLAPLVQRPRPDRRRREEWGPTSPHRRMATAA